MRLSRPFKIILLLASSGLLLLIGLTVFINFYYLKDIRLRAQEILTKVVGSEVGLESLTLDIFRGVTVKNVSLHNKNKIPLTVSSTRVGLNIKDLLKRKITLEDIQIQGVFAQISTSTDDNMLFFKEIARKFNPSQKERQSESLVSVDVESVIIRDLAIQSKTSFFQVDKINISRKDSKTVIFAEAEDFQDFATINLEAVVSNRMISAFAKASFTRPEIKKHFEWFSITSHFTDFARIPIRIKAVGPDIKWDGMAIVRYADQIVEIPAVGSSGFFKDTEFSFSAYVHDFQRFFYTMDFSSTSFPLSMIKPEASGNLSFQARISGNFKEKTWIIEQANAFSERINVVNLLSNVVGFSSFTLTMRNNAVQKFSSTVLSGKDVFHIQGFSGNIRNEPLELDIDVKGDKISLDQIKWDGRILKSEKQDPMKDYNVLVNASFLGVSFGSMLLSDFRLRSTITPGLAKGDQLSFIALGGTWVCDFDLAGDELSLHAAFRNLSLSQVRMGLSGQLAGHYNIRTKQPYIKGSLQDQKLGFQKFECSNLRSSVLFSNHRIILPDIVVDAYLGRVDASVSYDVSANKGFIHAIASSVDVSEIYQALLGPTPSRISGKGDLECSVDLGSKGIGLVTGKLRFKKGIIQDTSYQDIIAKKIGNDLLKDIILYDQINSLFYYENQILKIRDMEFISTDLEVRMGLDYNLATGKRTSIEPYKILMSEVFVQSFPQIVKLPISYVTTKKGKWTLLQVEEKSGAISLIK